MIPIKIKEHLDNYIHQEVYVQIAVIKGKEKISTKAAIENYFHSFLTLISLPHRNHHLMKEIELF